MFESLQHKKQQLLFNGSGFALGCSAEICFFFFLQKCPYSNLCTIFEIRKCNWDRRVISLHKATLWFLLYLEFCVHNMRTFFFIWLYVLFEAWLPYINVRLIKYDIIFISESIPLRSSQGNRRWLNLTACPVQVSCDCSTNVPALVSG